MGLPLPPCAASRRARLCLYRVMSCSRAWFWLPRWPHEAPLPGEALQLSCLRCCLAPGDSARITALSGLPVEGGIAAMDELTFTENLFCNTAAEVTLRRATVHKVLTPVRRVTRKEHILALRRRQFELRRPIARAGQTTLKKRSVHQSASRPCVPALSSSAPSRRPPRR